jgi:hypothetical protein
MNTNEMWQAYLGDTTPVSIFERYQTHDAWEAAQRAADDLPDVFGILRRGTWKDSFQQGEQYNRETVAVALWQHLEETREDWEPSLPELKAPAPAPEPEPAPREDPEPEVSTEPVAHEEAPEASPEAPTEESGAEASESTEASEDDAAPTDEATPDKEA